MNGRYFRVSTMAGKRLETTRGVTDLSSLSFGSTRFALKEAGVPSGSFQLSFRAPLSRQLLPTALAWFAIPHLPDESLFASSL